MRGFDCVFGRMIEYYKLAKPGIVIGNTLSLLGGYFFALMSATGRLSFSALGAGVLGTAAVMASSCILNNLIDIDIDARMSRTRRRGTVTGTVDITYAFILCLLLLAAGELMLYVFTPSITPYLALIGWVMYGLVYTYYKRVSHHATLLGSLPGAIPPVIGYYTAYGTDIWAAVALFAVIVCWQMVHFYAIAIMRRDDYASAAVPVLSVVRGVDAAYRSIGWWTLLVVIALILSMYFASVTYAMATFLIAIWFLRQYRPGAPADRARQVFVASLYFLPLWLAGIIAAGLMQHIT